MSDMPETIYAYEGEGSSWIKESNINNSQFRVTPYIQKRLYDDVVAENASLTADLASYMNIANIEVNVSEDLRAKYNLALAVIAWYGDEGIYQVFLGDALSCIIEGLGDPPATMGQRARDFLKEHAEVKIED